MAESPKVGQQIAPMPSLAQGAELIGEYEGAGFKEPVFLVRRGDGQMIQLSRLVYLVATEADGQKDFGQIALRVSSEFGQTVSADNIRFLVENKLQPLGVSAANEDHSPKLPRAKPVLALKFRVPIAPQGAIRTIAAVFRPLFLTPVLIAMFAGLATLDLWLFFIHGFGQSARETLYQPELLVVVFGLTLLATLFHELGHATACHYGGAKPGRIGVGIYIVWPIFYNDVTDTYRLGKIGRLRTDLGGVYFDVIFALAIAGAYFLTGSEWLLLLVLLQQLDILFQFMPFVRLDGYYLVSDLTGVPDLFARIAPILKSMIPGRETDKRVEELKPWVRVVVTTWVLVTIPTLLFVFALLVAIAPQLYATAWDSFLNYQDKVQSAFGDGRVVAGVADLIRIVLLLIPVVGITLLFLLAGKGLGGMVWGRSRGKPALRAALVAIVLAIGAILPFVWAPLHGGNGPIQRAERANFGGIADPAVSATGRNVPAPEGADGGLTPPGGWDRHAATPKPAGYASSGGASASAASASAASASAPAAASASATSASAPAAASASPAPAEAPAKATARGSAAPASATSSSSAAAPTTSASASASASAASTVSAASSSTAAPTTSAAASTPGGGGRAPAPGPGNVVIRQQATQTSSQMSGSPAQLPRKLGQQ